MLALGFLLGQAWYDVATRAYPDYAETMTGRLAVTLFATVACLLALTAFDGANKKALSERDVHEAKMLTSALAMVQGWLWCDAVDVGLDAWRAHFDRSNVGLVGGRIYDPSSLDARSLVASRHRWMRALRVHH